MIQCRCRQLWWSPRICYVLGIDLPQPGKFDIVQTVRLCRLLDPCCALEWCMRPIFCGSCGPLLRLWGMLLPIRLCMIRHWPLFWCLLWSLGGVWLGFLVYVIQGVKGGHVWVLFGRLSREVQSHIIHPHTRNPLSRSSNIEHPSKS